MNKLTVEAEHIAVAGIAYSRRALSNPIEYWLNVGRGSRDSPQHLACPRLVFQLLLKLPLTCLLRLEQPRVLDGDEGSIGEGFEEFNLPFGKASKFRSPNDDRADGKPILKHGRCDETSVAGGPGYSLMLVFGVRIHIRDLLHSPAEDGAGRYGRPTGTHRIFATD